VQTIAAQFDSWTVLNQVVVPDLWQQQAIAALRSGKDVIVHAPTGAGKTLIFEQWSNQGKNRGQAIYTVPTRALANDKLAEWRARGWEVGIATGDLAENLNAPVLVATLETQKRRLIEGNGPSLLVVDEYQMLADPDRGLNYELAIALAPPQTQLLLLSGSVGNPNDVAAWLKRLGRDAVLIRHDQRPVPLEEVHANHLNYNVPGEIRGYWPRLVAKCLADDLGPILIFAPRRQAAEGMAAELTRVLPIPNPLALTPEQKGMAGENLARMLRSRVAYHHSGLSYGARAGVIEPLAKAGQLRVVVATMGLAAGINFSLRSVALAGDSYRREHIEQPIRPDEILQMFGRAGRRGLDETGYVLITANQLRLIDGYPRHLSRSAAVDWSALLGVMGAAAEAGEHPFAAAVQVQERLFTTKRIFLGIEEAIRHPQAPCGLQTDAERARHVRKRVRQMLNSEGQWELFPGLSERPVREIVFPIKKGPATEGFEPASVSLAPVLGNAQALEKVGPGVLVQLSRPEEALVYGRGVVVAERLNEERLLITKWARRMIGWSSRQAPAAFWESKIAPLIEKRFSAQKLPVIRFKFIERKIVAELSLAEQKLRVPVDSHGVAIWRPVEREVLPEDCARCTLIEACRGLPAATGVALLWRRLGLVDTTGKPTRRGQIVSYFSQGDGLAIAAGLEDETYSLDELIYDLANLDAGFRFCGEEHRWGGRLAMACRQIYGTHSVPGYLENGVPPKYGAGAEQVVASVHKNPVSKHGWVTELLGAGDIDRIIIEWRSLLRRISHAPELEWQRWALLQKFAREILDETESPTLTELPPLDFSQTKRVDHRLILRRH
jgi:superfamily II DNA/RNA helicase